MDQFTTLSGYPVSPAIDPEPFTARKWDIGSTKDDASTRTWLVTGAYINATGFLLVVNLLNLTLIFEFKRACSFCVIIV